MFFLTKMAGALPFIKIENRVLEKIHKSQAKDLGRDEIAK